MDITVNIDGMDRILEKLASIAGDGKVKAGVLEGATNAKGTSVLQYAPIQEFGGIIPVTKKMRGFLAAVYGIYLKKTTGVISIPSRPFLRTTYEQNADKWVEHLGRAIEAGRSVEDALELVGMEMEDDIINTIKSNLPPPNSEATNKIKAQEAPAALGKTLQFTGTLIHSIKHEVE